MTPLPVANLSPSSIPEERTIVLIEFPLIRLSPSESSVGTGGDAKL
jgi:hypothetical protein